METGTADLSQQHAFDQNTPDLSQDMAPVWGSDAIAACLRALKIPYLALVPGSSFRGLHDSLVNYLGNHDPDLVLCLHEEHAVAIADGYAKVTGQPMAVALHANVGLMHATMAIYNAWCERNPMLLIGGNGPMDADQRRPWIDWVHTSRDPGALIRAYVKWDDHPASAKAGIESLLRANQITRTEPCGPVYVALDVGMQESPAAEDISIPDVSRFLPAPSPAIPATTLDQIIQTIRDAQFPVLLAGRGSRSQSDWDKRVALAEKIGGVVLTTIHNQSIFPNEHPLHLLPTCGEKVSSDEMKLIARADVIISLDWMDLAGFLRAASGHSQTQHPVAATVIHASLETTIANGWSMDHQALPAVDIPVLAGPDTLVNQLLDKLGDEDLRGNRNDITRNSTHWRDAMKPYSTGSRDGNGSDNKKAMDIDSLAATIDEFCSRHSRVTLSRLPIGWPSRAVRFRSPLCYMGKDTGGAVGSGPGHSVGTALALKNTDRLVVGVLGDGDFLMGINALWTASHLQLPMMIVVANNQSYFNDELHQERVAIARERPVENRWIGQKLNDPPVNLIAMAEAQGFDGEGPVTNPADLLTALLRGASVVADGGRVMIDARITPGYSKG